MGLQTCSQYPNTGLSFYILVYFSLFFILSCFVRFKILLLFSTVIHTKLTYFIVLYWNKCKRQTKILWVLDIEILKPILYGLVSILQDYVYSKNNSHTLNSFLKKQI